MNPPTRWRRLANHRSAKPLLSLRLTLPSSRQEFTHYYELLIHKRFSKIFNFTKLFQKIRIKIQNLESFDGLKMHEILVFFFGQFLQGKNASFRQSSRVKKITETFNCSKPSVTIGDSPILSFLQFSWSMSIGWTPSFVHIKSEALGNKVSINLMLVRYDSNSMTHTV